MKRLRAHRDSKKLLSSLVGKITSSRKPLKTARTSKALIANILPEKDNEKMANAGDELDESEPGVVRSQSLKEINQAYKILGQIIDE